MIGQRPVETFFAKRSPSVKKLALDLDSLDEARMKQLMLEEPRLMRRPVLKVGRKVLVGFDAEAWAAALA